MSVYGATQNNEMLLVKGRNHLDWTSGTIQYCTQQSFVIRASTFRGNVGSTSATRHLCCPTFPLKMWPHLLLRPFETKIWLPRTLQDNLKIIWQYYETKQNWLNEIVTHLFALHKAIKQAQLKFEMISNVIFLHQNRLRPSETCQSSYISNNKVLRALLSPSSFHL